MSSKDNNSKLSFKCNENKSGKFELVGDETTVDTTATTSSSNEDFKYNVAADAAAGDLSNDQVKYCYVCKDIGYPHEAIEIQKVNGRLRNDGTFEATSWTLKDYYTGEPHQHKSRKQGEQQEQKETGHYLGWDLGRC
jgi:hypothetical protein